MSPEKQRIKIAEACGFEFFPSFDRQSAHGIFTAVPECWRKDDVDYDESELPDYLGDLNAMHEAVEFLKEKYGGCSVGNLHRNYFVNLLAVMNPGVTLWDNGKCLGDVWHGLECAEATAAQRAESFLKSLNLWTN